MTILLRCALIVFLLSSLPGCGPAADRTREAQQGNKPTKNPQVIEPVQKTGQQSPGAQVIESKSQAPDPETQKLYNELDKELAELKNVLDSLDTVDEKDLNTNF